MKKDQFLDFMQYPELLNQDSSVMLEGLLKEFPYCQTAQILYLKSLHNEKSIHYPNRLKVAAAYSADRRALYKFIMQPELQIKIHKAEQFFEENKGLIPELKDTSEIISDKDKITTTESNSIETIIEIQKETPKNEQENINANAEIAELETEILNEVISASIGFDLASELLNEQSQDLGPLKQGGEKSILATDQEKYTFSEWMKLLNGKKEEKREEGNLVKNTTSTGADLIEKFIQEEPKIKPLKTAFFSPVNMAKMSLLDKDDFVTETLAKVYAKQGNYNKAIKAYQNLILKYPEKSTYFAVQIQELKKKNNNK